MIKKKISLMAFLFMLAVVVIVAGCSKNNNSANQPPAAQPPAAQPPAVEQPSAPAADEEWKQEWDRVVAAAKQEGKLILSAPPSQIWRDALMTFEQDFPEIKIEYTGANSRDFWPRIEREREVGQFLWDVRIGGPDPHVYNFLEAGNLLEAKELFILPEVKDESKYSGGFDRVFKDKNRSYAPAFQHSVSSLFSVNRNVYSEAQVNKDADLINPAYKGQIVLQDPRGGQGLGNLSVLLKANGEEFVRKLLTEMDIVITGDNRQMAEWLVRGRYNIGIGVADDEILYFSQQGLQAPFLQRATEASIPYAVGFAGVQMIERPANPNAAIVFLNWLFTKDVQERISKMTEGNSLRNDVAPARPDIYPDPAKLSEYYDHQDEDFRSVRDAALKLANELIK